MNKEQYTPIENKEGLSQEYNQNFLRMEDVGIFLHQNEKKFTSFNLHIELDKSRNIVKDLYGNILAIPVTGDYLDADDNSDYLHQWITVDFSNESGSVIYYLGDKKHIIEERKMSPAKLFETRIAIDAVEKKVTARSSYAYNKEFLLDYSDVWPQDADILVVGDPYQRCDRDRTTIIDYEYADEIFPNFLDIIDRIRDGELDEGSLFEELERFFENLHIGDDVALSYVHGSFSPSDGNPYKIFIRRCIEAQVKIIMKYAKNQNDSNVDKLTGDLQAEYIKLRRGEWSVDDYKMTFDENDDYHQDNVNKFNRGLEEYFSIKEYSVNPDKENIDKYIDSWHKFFDSIPDDLKEKLDIEEKMLRVEHWLNVMSRIDQAMPERLQKGIGEIQGIYKGIINNIWQLNESDKAKLPKYFQSHIISDVYNKGLMSDSPFGVAVPGIPINSRVDNYLGDAVDYIRRTNTYFSNILPILEQEKNRIIQQGIRLSDEMMDFNLYNIEYSLVKEQIHKKRTQRSVVLHGFFPGGMPEIDQQDRIVASYSTSTHIWKRFDKQDFVDDLTKSIEYLKIGGKYIAGPINYAAYRVWFREGELPANLINDFPSKDLHDACEELRKKGLIDYYFTKVAEDDFEEVDDNVMDTKDFGDGDVAGSLVITRLK